MRLTTVSTIGKLELDGMPLDGVFMKGFDK